MFTQFKNAVESLAQQAPSSANTSGSSTRNKTRSPPPMASKPSIAGSLEPSARRTSSSDSRSRAKLSLEDRLRATFVTESPSPSLTSSPSPSDMANQSPSATDPSDIPLPLSPLCSQMESSEAIPNDHTDPLRDQTFQDTAPLKESANSFPVTPGAGVIGDGVTVKLEELKNEMPPEPAKEDDRASFSIHEEAAGTEQLQLKLKLIEKRFADVSASYAKLQAEKEEVDRFVSSISSTGLPRGISGVRMLFEELKIKEETAQQEIIKLKGTQNDQILRIQELRDVHRLESVSQSEQIERLKSQLQESEKLIAADAARAHNKDDEVASLRKALEEQKQVSKEEEEKRTKAIGLLKSVRQKLVRIEREKEESTRQLEELKEKERVVQNKDLAERSQWESQIESLRAGKEREMREAKSAWEQSTAERISHLQEEERIARKLLELELTNLKADVLAEQSAKNSKISALESSIQTLTRQKEELFDQLQLRSAELESSQSLLEVLQSRTKELEFRLRESSDHATGLREELSIARAQSPAHIDGESRSNEEVTRLLLETQGKYESRLSEARTRIRILEKERIQAEEDWNRGIIEKSQALETLRLRLDAKDKELGSLVNSQKDTGTINSKLESSLKGLSETLASRDRQIEELHSRLAIASEQEASLGQQLHDANERIDAISLQLEGAKEKELQLKTSSKVIKEELRKVQSSVALLERQRNPGVGFWGSLGGERPQSPVDSRRSGSIESSNGATAFMQSTSEEEINYEYLRNVILQFLEHKDRRPNLVRVLSTILRFTPQETRRLVSKV